MEFMYSLWHLLCQSFKDYLQKMGWVAYPGISGISAAIWTWIEEEYPKDKIKKILKRFIYINGIIFFLIVVINIYDKVQQLKFDKQTLFSSYVSLKYENEKLKNPATKIISIFDPNKIVFYIGNNKISDNSTSINS